MKIEHLLARHLYASKQLTLQGIGTFSLSPDFILPAETDKISELPQGSISFTQNVKATEDPALIDFIVQQTRKMKPLASSDLESFIGLGSQFLNIGKPFKIEGIGMLEKNQLGEYLFTQYGQIITLKPEDGPVQIKEKRDERSAYEIEDGNRSGNGKKIAFFIIGLVLLAGIGWAGWYFYTQQKQTDKVSAPAASEENKITPDTGTAKKDSTAALSMKPSDSLTAAPPPPAASNGSYTFKIVFKITANKAAAIEKMDVLTKRGHKVIMYSSDSVTFKLAEPFNLPLSDTAKVKDSLNRFYYLGKAKVEL
ncbi:MAG: hypothetical protein U0V75_05580 [Ferruginibacter sp.]